MTSDYVALGTIPSAEDAYYQEAWSRVKIIKLRRRIAELEGEQKELRSTQRHMDAELRAFKAAYAMATRALQESNDPHLRLLKILRHPASESVVEIFSKGGKLALADLGKRMEVLEVALELARLGKLSMEDGFFAPTAEGKTLFEEFQLIDHAADPLPKAG